MKKNTTAIVNIVIWSLITVLLISVLTWGIKAKNQAFSPDWRSFPSLYFGNMDNRDYTVGDSSVNASDVKTLEIDWVAGEVIIQTTDSDRISFSESFSGNHNDSKKMCYKLADEKLSIAAFKTGHSMVNASTLKKTLTVSVPRNQEFDLINISNVSSNIEVSDVTARDIDIENVSGKVSVMNHNGRTLDFETISGKMEYTGYINKIDCETVSGSLTFMLKNCPAEIDCESVSGSTTIMIPENDGFSAVLDGMSGKLSSDFATSTEKDRLTYKNGGSKFIFETVSGSVTVNKSSQDVQLF